MASTSGTPVSLKWCNHEAETETPLPLTDGTDDFKTVTIGSSRRNRLILLTCVVFVSFTPFSLSALRALRMHMGITRLANLTGLDSIGLAVYTAIRPNSRSLAASQGKGLDADSAKVSAMMESMEGWHAEHIHKPLHWESYLSLRDTASVVDVTALPRHPGGELRLDVPRLWVEGYDIMQQKRMWVPYDSVTANNVFPRIFSRHSF